MMDFTGGNRVTGTLIAVAAALAVVGTALIVVLRTSGFLWVGLSLSILAVFLALIQSFFWRRKAGREVELGRCLESIHDEFADRLTFSEALEKGLPRFADIVGATRALALLQEHDDGPFEIDATWGSGGDQLDHGAAAVLDSEVLNSIVRSGRRVLVDLAQPRFAESPLAVAGSKWAWIAPFKARAFNGALLAAGSGPNLGSTNSALADALVDDLSKAADIALVYEREAERARLMSILAEFGSVAVSLSDEEHARSAAVDALRKLFPRGSGYLTTFNADVGNLTVSHTYSSSEGSNQALQGLRGSEECDGLEGCRAISSGGVYEGVGNRGLWDCPYRKTGNLAPTFACAPIVDSSSVLGAIHVARKSGAAFAEDETKVLSALGSQLGLSISNARLLEATKEQAVRDPMTGLFNYRFLVEFMANQVAAARRDEKPISALMIDIDHFRDFNNSFGHAAGDHVLRELAKILERHVRASDLAARYGGEEFTVVLPDADTAGAVLVAENIRKEVERTELSFGGKDLGALRVSIGAATLPNHASTPEDLLKQADAALYLAKESGRNMVKSA